MRYAGDLRHPLQAPCGSNASSGGGTRRHISPVVEAVGMWESRKDFQRVWEGWKAGFMAFHAFHTLSFPWPALPGDLDQSAAPLGPIHRARHDRYRARLSMRTSADHALIDTLWKIEGSHLSFTSWAATLAAQDLRGGSTQRAGRSVHRYAR